MRREASPAATMPPSPGSLLWDLPAYPESYAARLVTIAALAGHLSAKLGRAPTCRATITMRIRVNQGEKVSGAWAEGRA